MASFNGGPSPLARDLDANSNNITDINEAVADRVDFATVDQSVSTTDPASSSITLDAGNSHWHEVGVNQNTTINLTESADVGDSMIVYITDTDGMGSYTISWPSNVQWSGGSAPTTVDQSGDLRVTLTKTDSNSDWRGIKSGSGFA